MNNYFNPNIIFLDYLNSDNPAVIDQGIRDTIKGVHQSILTMSIALARVKQERIFRKLNYKNMNAYILQLCHEYHLVKSSMYKRLKIGEAFLKYRDDLEKIGFNDADSPTKLSHLEKALTVKEKDEVYTKLKEMNSIQFADYAKAKKPNETSGSDVLEVRGNIAYHMGRPAIIVSKDLGNDNKKMIMEVFNIICNAINRGGYVVAVNLRNKKEGDLFSVEAEKIRAEIQKKKPRKKSTKKTIV